LEREVWLLAIRFLINPINNPDGDAEIGDDDDLIEYLINATLHEMIIKAARQAPGSTRDHDC
jgi:hypothetical protein